MGAIWFTIWNRIWNTEYLAKMWFFFQKVTPNFFTFLIHKNTKTQTFCFLREAFKKFLHKTYGLFHMLFDQWLKMGATFWKKNIFAKFSMFQSPFHMVNQMAPITSIMGHLMTCSEKNWSCHRKVIFCLFVMAPINQPLIFGLYHSNWLPRAFWNGMTIGITPNEIYAIAIRLQWLLMNLNFKMSNN